MSRAIWKGPYTFIAQNKNKNYASRNSDIVPKFIGNTFLVHSGNQYKEVIITTEMIGHKFGEFVFTRAKYVYKKKKKNKKIKNGSKK